MTQKRTLSLQRSLFVNRAAYADVLFIQGRRAIIRTVRFERVGSVENCSIINLPLRQKRTNAIVLAIIGLCMFLTSVFRKRIVTTVF